MNTFSSDKAPKKLAIFDLDGTLINTIGDLGESVSYALKVLGLPVRTMEEYTNFVGNGTMKLIERSLPEIYRNDSEMIVKAHDLFSQYYSEHYADMSCVYDGITKALDELKKRGISLCVLTNKPDGFAKLIISKFFRDDVFDTVIGAREGVPKKPDPAAEKEIIEAIGSCQSHAIHIGDSDVDVLTAHNAGIRCVGCSWGFRTRESLVAAGADYIADKPEELVDAVVSLGL